MYVRIWGRREAENQLLRKLEREFCNPQLLKNPRITDVVKQLEKIVIEKSSKTIRYHDDYVYNKYILPKIERWIHNSNHFWLTDEGNIKIAVPLKQKGSLGEAYEKQREIQYNGLKDGMEKVYIYDYRRGGMERLFKSVRYIYDKNGIEIERQVEMLKRDTESVKTVYWYRERLKDNPHIIKIIHSSKPTKQQGKISYYNIQNNNCIENLDIPYEENENLNELEGKIEEKDIKNLTLKEKEKIIENMNPIYQYGMSSLMGVDIEQEVCI